MKKYLIAIFEYSESTNRLFVLDAENDVDAAKKALISHCAQEFRDQQYIDWVNGLGETWDEVSHGALQSNMILSAAMQLSSINTLASLTQTQKTNG